MSPSISYHQIDFLCDTTVIVGKLIYSSGNFFNANSRMMGAMNIFVIGVTAIYLRPEYAIWGSRIWTGAAFCVVFSLSKAIYQLFLYPQFFSPLRHIQTPPVSSADSHYALCG
jgi:hypothetical protein